MSEDNTVKGPGGHYSGRNKIPTVNQFLERLDKDKKERDKQIDEDKKAAAAQKQAGGEDVKPHQNKEMAVKGSQKRVKDPTTGREVVIEDVNDETMDNVKNPTISVPNANLGKDTPVKTDPSQSGQDYQEKQDVTAPPDPVEPGTTSDVPIHGEKTNVLFHPTPSVSYEPTFQRLETRANIMCVAILLAIIVVGKMFGGSLKGLIPLSMCISSGLFLYMKEIVRSGREVEWKSEKDRGKYATANLLPESVEWMNTLIGVVWGLINPEMFSAIADQIEDVMQASVPGVIENVRVAEINQGSNPFRMLSLRALPDSHMTEIKQKVHEENKKTKDPQELAADEAGGNAYNLEASFAYHSEETGSRTSEKARNMHMQIIFYLGVKGLVGVPFPIFVELQRLVGTVRLRLEMTPDPPFLKSLTFTLMGVPKVQAGCVPMLERGVNILNLPLISNFVNYAIGAAASMYVAPKSMSLDMKAMLSGDDLSKDVGALGVLMVKIHRAEGLSKQDKRGSEGGGSDPYVVLTFSKYSKPMYCTRVITDDLNPVWEETAFLLVAPELIKADEDLSIELWDSDRHSADDVVGKVEIPLQKIIQHPGEIHPHASKLAGAHADSEMPGILHTEVGFFGKTDYRPALRTDQVSRTLDKNLQDRPEFQDDTGVNNTAQEDAVMHTPPDPLFPTGVCSVIVHQIVGLELENIKGSDGDRKGKEFEPAKPFGEAAQETGGNLPTSYCTILFNDELTYRTRAKAISSQPIFNAGTEKVVRDWRSAIVTVTVRDSRNRQHDPILGVVPLKLSDILETRSQVTRWYPLDGGIGFGRIRISLLFRSIETRLPPPMLGYEVGTFEFTSPRILALGYTHHAAIKLRTGGSSGRLGKTHCRKLDEGDGFYWDLASKHGSQICLPVKYRYRSPVIFEFHLPNKRAADAYAMIWLQNLIDNEDTPINLPIYKTSRPDRLVQNYLTEETLSAGHVPSLHGEIKEIGRLQFRGRFKAGMDASHGSFVVDNDTRETFETWECCYAEGVRGTQVEREVPEKVQQLHDKSLTEGRDVLKAASDAEKRRWLSKTGEDWSGAFSKDPNSFPNREHDDEEEDDDEDDDEDKTTDVAPEDQDISARDAAHMPPPPRTPDGSTANTNGTRSPESPSRNSAVTQSTDAYGRPSTTSPPNRDSMSPSSIRSSGTTRTQDTDKLTKSTEKRRHRGLMQWKPARNAKFAKDEAVLGLRKLKGGITGGLEGRQPDVETETG